MGKKFEIKNNDISDGYHTFDELYHHRFILTKALFNSVKYKCLKSKLHSDGTMFDNYFIVGCVTDFGWATYHYPIENWNDFYCEEVERFPEWDGHTSDMAIERLDKYFEMRNLNINLEFEHNKQGIKNGK